jgi:hypothetical protein
MTPDERPADPSEEPPDSPQPQDAPPLDAPPPDSPQPQATPDLSMAADPLVSLPPGGSRLLSASFDLLLGASVELRRASLYVGIVFALTVGPLVLLLVGAALHGMTFHDVFGGGDGGTPPSVDTAAFRLQEAMLIAMLVAVLGYLVVAVESQAVAIGILAGHLAARPISLREAVVRSRAVFWRLVRGSLLAGIPVACAQLTVQTVLSSAGQVSQGAALVATTAGTLVGIPFVYVGTGIVLGDVRAFEAVRRSVRLVRFRRGTAVILAVFAALAQYLLVFGLGIAGDLVSRLASVLDLGSHTPPAVAVTVVAVSGLMLALGTLLFTVAAVSVGPQVVAFLALTRYIGGLDRARADALEQGGKHAVLTGPESAPESGAPATYWVLEPVHRPRFRWLTRPLLAGIALGILALAAGLAQLPPG